jgi:predicted lipoprotein with Yx(FWY)xxD motif
MKTRHLLVPALLALSFAAGSAAAADVGLKKADGILVDANGKTVYTFDKDVADSGKSACTGQCASLWPPVTADAAQPAAPYSVITREDGIKQVTYKGKPLYHYSADQKSGDRKGDNFKDIWHVVKD